MYGTRPEAADPAVDELKRRARRRLVGAIVLALAAAVILPLLLESDPKPLGDDVSIKIPPIDNGQFVNPLSPGKTPDAKAGNAGRDKKAAPAEPAAPDTTSAQRSVESQARAPGQSTQAVPAADTGKSAAPPDADAAGTKTEASPQGNAFAVQVAALADAKAASDLAAKLRAGGYPGYTEAFSTSQGPMQRVRVGPYSSRDTADAALAKLKAAGYEGVVSTAK